MKREVFYSLIGLTVLLAVLSFYGPADARCVYRSGAFISGIAAFVWASL